MNINVTGNYNLVLTPEAFILNTANIYLQCQTSGANPPVVIILPRITTIEGITTTWGFKVFINDVGNNASVKTITLVPHPADKINGSGAPIVLNTNGVTGILQISGTNSWDFNVGSATGSIAPIDFTIFVGKNGNDGTANGSIAKPYLTVQSAINYAYTLSNATTGLRPSVYVMAGIYTETITLKPNVAIRGMGINHTRIIGDFSADATWSNTNDNRASLFDFTLSGDINLDFAALLGTKARIVISSVKSFGTNIFTAGGSSCQLFIYDGEWGGGTTITGTETYYLGADAQSLPTLTYNSSAIGSNNLFIQGNALFSIIINAVAFAMMATLNHQAQFGATLTINGTLSNIQYTLGAIPLQSNIILLGGATLNQLSSINQLNFSGITVSRPTQVYVGVTYFDTTLGIPIWYNGVAWINAIGALV